MHSKTLPFTLAAGLAVVVAWSCSDSSQPLTEAVPAPSRSPTFAPGTCTNLGDVTSNAQSYFSGDDETTVLNRLDHLSSACANGNQPATASLAWGILDVLEDVLQNGKGGDPGIGADFVNGILDCIEDLCAPGAGEESGLDFLAALGPQGIFAVRYGGSTPAIARGPISFVDFDGKQNQGLWGIEVQGDWETVTGADPLLLYGGPLMQNPTTILDQSLGDVQANIKRYPIVGKFVDGGLHVGLCLKYETTLPHPNDDPSLPPLEPRIQRESVLLEDYSPGFCGGFSMPASASIQSASVVGSALAGLRSLLLSPPPPAFAERRIVAVGGTPLDFSRFAPVGAATDGFLEFVSGPDSRAVEGESVGDIQVRARSGGGTPIEKVEVTLSIKNNKGEPAGAFLTGDVVSVTDEDRGIAVFGDLGADPPAANKPGGYLLCATGTVNGFTFAEVCSERFHVNKAKK